MKLISTATLVVAALASAPLRADDALQPGLVLRRRYQQGHLGISGQTCRPDATVDNTETTYTIRTGWRFHHPSSRSRSATTTSASTPTAPRQHRRPGESKSVGGSLVGILPMNQFDLYGRIGYARTEPR
jgi:hypothetical protein